MVKNLNKNLFITCSYVLDVFFVRDTIERDMPDRNVKTLAVGSVFSLVTERRVRIPENGLRQWHDLDASRGEQNPCLVDVPEGEGLRDAVIP